MIPSQTPSNQLPQDFFKTSNSPNKHFSDNNQDKTEQNLNLQNQIPEESQRLEFLENSSKEFVSLTKLNDLSKSQMKVLSQCYIPEKNLLLVIEINKQKINIYSTIDFKLLSVVERTPSTEVHVISYSKELNKILVGGTQNSIEFWNPITFKTESRTYDEALGASHYIENIEYIQEFNIIFAATKSTIFIYDTKINLMSQFQCPKQHGSWECLAGEIFTVSNDRLLVTCKVKNEKFFVLLNLKTQTVKEYNGFYISEKSAIERIGPNKFVSLVKNLDPGASVNEGVGPNKLPSLASFFMKKSFPDLKISEMTFNVETEELELKEVVNSKGFCRLIRVEKSKYFLGQFKIDSGFYGVGLFCINENKIETTRIPFEQWAIWEKGFIMMKDGFCMIQIGYQDDIWISNMKIQQEKEPLDDQEN